MARVIRPLSGVTGLDTSGAAIAARRNGLRFVEGSNVTIAVTDDAANGRIDVTVSSTGGSGSGLTEAQVRARVSMRI